MRILQCLLCLGIAMGPRALAAAQSIALRWEAPSSCASESTVQAKIRELLADDELVRRAQVRAHVQIVRARGRYQLKLALELGKHRAERRLHGTKCDELSDTVAWLIAVAINPELSVPSEQIGPELEPHGSAREQEREGKARTQATSDGDSARPLAPEGTAGAEHEGGAQAAASDERTGEATKATATRDGEQAPTSATSEDTPSRSATLGRLSIVNRTGDGERELQRSLHAGLAAGVFGGGPSAAQAALSAFVGLGLDWSYTQARFSGHLPRRVDIGQSASAHVWSLSLDLTQCALWGSQVRAGPCLALAGLRSAANVRGLAQTTHHAALWADVSAGMQLFWRLARSLELSFALAVGTPISPRPRFTVLGLGPIASAKAWSGDARLGLSFVTD